jgi:hypothetical protein
LGELDASSSTEQFAKPELITDLSQDRFAFTKGVASFLYAPLCRQQFA